jgi:hypothetical protein
MSQMYPTEDSHILLASSSCAASSMLPTSLCNASFGLCALCCDLMCVLCCAVLCYASFDLCVLCCAVKAGSVTLGPGVDNVTGVIPGQHWVHIVPNCTGVMCQTSIVLHNVLGVNSA